MATGDPPSWTRARAKELRRLIDSSIAQQVRKLGDMPEHYYTSARVDKAGLLSLLEQASIAVEAVHDVVSELPLDFGPSSRRASVQRGRKLLGRVTIAQRFHDQYRPLFDPTQEIVPLWLKTRGVVCVRVAEGEFLVDGSHLIQAG